MVAPQRPPTADAPSKSPCRLRHYSLNWRTHLLSPLLAPFHHASFLLYMVLLTNELLSLALCTGATIYRLPLRRFDALLNVAGSLNVDRSDGGRSRRGIDLLRQEGSLYGRPGQGYYIAVDIGTPPQRLNVLIDTGSSNFAVAASPHPYTDRFFNMSASQSLIDTGSKVDVPYTQGDWKGLLGSDYVSLTSLGNFSSFRTNIAFITSSHRFFINGSQWHGIVGLAYRSIARPDHSIEPFLDALVRETGIYDVFSLQLCGIVSNQNPLSDADIYGSLIIGGIDNRMFTGPLLYVPIRQEWYYEVIIADLLVGTESLALDCKEYNFDKTIVDSGTTNLRLPNRVFDALVEQLKKQVKVAGAVKTSFWTGDDIVCFRTGASPSSFFPSITIQLASSNQSTVNLKADALQYLQQVPYNVHEVSGKDCYRFSVTASETGAILGAIFMEGFYVVFDRSFKRIGFASSSCRQRDNEPLGVVSSSDWSRKTNLMDCGYIRPEPRESLANIAMYIIAAICGCCAIPLILIIIRRQIVQCRERRDVTSAPADDINQLVNK